MDDTVDSWSSPLGSVDGQEDIVAYETPVTSPDNSPIKTTGQHCPGIEEQCDKSDDEVEEVIPMKRLDRVDVEDIKRCLHGKSSTRGCRAQSTRFRLPSSAISTPTRTHDTSHISMAADPRFVGERHKAPTKERFLLSRSRDSPGPGATNLDHWRLSATRAAREAGQFFVVTRNPAYVQQPYGMNATDLSRDRRHIEAMDFTWFAGGQPVTEGVASTTDGRGGRLTSGTNAPLQTADLVDQARNPPEITHFGRRLADVMDIDLITSMNKLSLPKNAKIDKSVPSKAVIWKDFRWQRVRPLKRAAAEKLDPVPTNPFRLLEARYIRNDYYCSLLAYCGTLNCIAIALGNDVHIWADRWQRQLVDLPEVMWFPREAAHITSLAFSSLKGGKSILAIGRADGRLVLWTPTAPQPRLSCVQPYGVTHVSFRPIPARRPSERDQNIWVDTEELLVGTEDGSVALYSIEWPDEDLWHLFNWPRSMKLRAKIFCNTEQIYGIAWSQDGEVFATGGNDNRLFVFDFDKVQRVDDTRILNEPRHAPRRYREGPDAPIIMSGREKARYMLKAAVKAIAFAPWDPTLIAASGGSNDRCIRFYHTNCKVEVANINCQAQVTSLHWNKWRQEIVATLGFAQPEHPNRIVTFSWPDLQQLTVIKWPGEERALYAIQVPMSGIGNSKKNDCLVVATSKHKIRFHQVWHERKISRKNPLGITDSTILNNTVSEGMLHSEDAR